MTERVYKSFAEFWPFYVREHSVRGNRAWHYIGTWLVLIVLAVAVVTTKLWMLILMPLFGYGFAWIGHFFVQKNIPATFTYPVWSLMGDFKMFWLMTIRKMAPEIVNAFSREQLQRETTL